MSLQPPSQDRTSALSRIPIRTVFVLCALLMIGLWLLQVHPYLSVANDAGRYMVLGESLARTGQLRLINDTRALPDTLYPPGFPAIIAFWLKVTGRDPGGVVELVKFGQLLLLLGTLPLLYRLLKRAGLPEGAIRVALIATSFYPALITYANEVMSEIPFLFCCLAAVSFGERDTRTSQRVARSEQSVDSADVEDKTTGEDSGGNPGAGELALSLAFGIGAFLMRTAGLALFVAQIVWFWRRFGWRWGMAAVVVALSVVGGWQVRNSRIVAHAPKGVHYSTYMDQFTLRDPMDPNAGRIPSGGIGLVKGLVKRAAFSLPLYVGYISRAPLFTMSPNSPWLVPFYLIAIPFTLLVFVGFAIGWRRGPGFSGLFTGLFWVMAALWPWRDARFLVPIVPLLTLYCALGAVYVTERAQSRLGAQSRVVPVTQAFAALVFLIYCSHVHAEDIRRERHPAMPGYAMGRDREEAGFYAACDWLKSRGAPKAIVMGRPAYLLHLYSLHPTTQIEPNTRPKVQEMGYMRPKKVHYLLQDIWSWAHTNAYIKPYLSVYGDRWQLAWQDPKGSGVKIWERINAPMPASSAGPALPTTK